jgi:hypothetical protein
VADDYCSWAEVRDSLGIPASAAREDERVKLAVKAATRGINALCGRFFYQVVGTRMFRLRGNPSPIPDAVELTSFGVYDSGGSLGLWSPMATFARLLPEDTLGVDGLGPGPATHIEAYGALAWITGSRATAVGTWGWPAVPEDIKMAAIIGAAELWKLKDAPFGVAGFGEYGAVRIRKNPKVIELCWPYVTGARVLGGV